MYWQLSKVAYVHSFKHPSNVHSFKPSACPATKLSFVIAEGGESLLACCAGFGDDFFPPASAVRGRTSTIRALAQLGRKGATRTAQPLRPRADKTTTLVVLAILEAPSAVVTTSNKGGTVDATRDPRSPVGQVWIFDPQAIALARATWWSNPHS